jgi:transposase
MRRTRRKFDRDFKIQTVKLITEWGMSAVQVARDLDIHENVLRKWEQQYLDDTLHTFPGKGHLKPKEEELRKLRTCRCQSRA